MVELPALTRLTKSSILSGPTMLFEVKTFKLEMSGVECGCSTCKRLPEYHFNLIGHVYHIKQDTICASICIDGFKIIVCRGCIDEVYQYIKSKLDTKLWMFQ